jgi:hypothetical protein
MIRLIISKDHADSVRAFQMFQSFNQFKPRPEPAGTVFGEKFDREAIEEPGLLELTGMAAFEQSIQIAITSA